jgi:FkbM family methyltransferase
VINKLKDILALHIPGYSPRVILECGAMDCHETLTLADVFKESTVYAFEVNPESIAVCQDTVSKSKDANRIVFFSFGLWSKDGSLIFGQSTSSNPGCSSFLQSSGKFDHVEPMRLKPIEVAVYRVDTLIESKDIASPPDFLWLDAQGSELEILKGFGKYIKNVRLIYTEIIYDEMYIGNPIRVDFDAFMGANGFDLVYNLVEGIDQNGKEWWGNACYINKKVV